MKVSIQGKLDAIKFL